MHISEGILSGPILLGGAGIALVGTAIGLKKIDYDQIVGVAILSAAFFVASLIHLPIGPSSVHLVLGGLLGVILGWAAFPAILVALFLQAVLFQFGGLTTLGLNCCTMAIPAVVCFYVFRPLLSCGGGQQFVAAFGCGFLSMFLSAILVAGILALSGDPFIGAAQMIVMLHLPVMVVEGIVTGFTYIFLVQVKPEILAVSS